MANRVRPARVRAAALFALTALLAACVGHNPVDEPDGDPDATPRATSVATGVPTPSNTPVSTPVATAAPNPTPIGSAHVALIVASTNAVTVDVKDSSGMLLAATSGHPGDGATVQTYALIVTNVSPTTLRLTWTGGPCDSANQLFIDKTRHQLLLVQPECPGDAIATDRMLDLTFTTPIKASDMDAHLQDGLDT